LSLRSKPETRRDKSLPSGFDPCSAQNAPESPGRGHGEAFNAREVRKLCKDVLPLGDYLSLCQISISELIEVIKFCQQCPDDDDEPEEITRVKQKLLRFQARARLEAKP
jgi:hypothetical protein